MAKQLVLDKVLNFRLTQEVFKELKARAKDQDKQAGVLVREIVCDYLNK